MARSKIGVYDGYNHSKSSINDVLVLKEKAKPLRSLMRPIKAFFASIFEYTDESFTPLTVANNAPIDSTDAKFKTIRYIMRSKILYILNKFTSKWNHKIIKFIFIF